MCKELRIRDLAKFSTNCRGGHGGRWTKLAGSLLRLKQEAKHTISSIHLQGGFSQPLPDLVVVVMGTSGYKQQGHGMAWWSGPGFCDPIIS